LTVKVEPATFWSVSRFSDQVTVTVVPFDATSDDEIAGAVVSTMNERAALLPETPVAESVLFARQ
jgi:hypothetical protein